MNNFTACLRRMVPGLLALTFALPPAFAQAPASGTNSPGSPNNRLTELFGDPLVAKGQGIEIKRSQLDAEILRTKETLIATQRQAPPDLDKQVLDGMIGLKLLLSKATDADRASAKEQFDKQFAAFKKDRKLTDEEFNEKLAPQLKLEGRTRAEWEQQQIEQASIPLVIKRELSVQLTDQQATNYYNENVSKFEEPETVRVSHILMSIRDPNDPNPNPLQKREISEDQKKAKRKQIDDLLKRARDGEDFAKLARDYSDDPGVKQNNGEYKFSREDPFAEEFKAAAFALKNTNQVSDVVITAFGYHIIKLLDKTPARKEPFIGLDTRTIFLKSDATRFTIRDVLNEEAQRKQLPDYIKKLRKEAAVEVLDPKLRIDDSALPASAPPKK